MVVGSTTPTVVVPSPFQSPTTGIQPGAPYWNGGMAGAPGPSPAPRYQVAVDGSKTPTLLVPSPNQSPVTGMPPGGPDGNGAGGGAGGLLVRRSGGAVDGPKVPAVKAGAAATGSVTGADGLS